MDLLILIIVLFGLWSGYDYCVKRKKEKIEFYKKSIALKKEEVRVVEKAMVALETGQLRKGINEYNLMNNSRETYSEVTLLLLQDSIFWDSASIRQSRHRIGAIEEEIKHCEKCLGKLSKWYILF